MTSCLRAGDLAARLAGDKFALVIADAPDEDQLRGLAERLVLQIDQPCEFRGRLLRVGVSIGIARAPAAGLAVSDLMARADMALYAAKAAGRGRSALYGPELAAAQRRRR